MNHHLLLLAAASFFLVAPIAQHQILGLETSNSTMVQQKAIISDADITHAIKQVISVDRDLSKFINHINVKTEKGVVTLSGTVNDAKVKAAIETQVKAVAGVNKVINNIEVKS